MSELVKPASYAAKRKAYISDELDLIEPFLNSKKAENTRKAYRRNLIKFFGKAEVYLSDAHAVDPDSVNQFIRDEEAAGLAKATISQCINAARSFYNWLDANKLLHINPLHPELIAGVKTTRKRDREFKCLTREQARHLLEVAGAEVKPNGKENKQRRRDEVIVLLMLHSGLRAGEVIGFDSDDLVKMSDRWIVRIPTAKSGSNQYVPLPTHIAEKVKVYIAGQDGPVFRSACRRCLGSRLSEDGLWRILKSIGARAGVPWLTPHVLRHTYATLAYDEGRGASMEVIKEDLRHADIKTTAGYIHRVNRYKHAGGDFIKL